MSQDEWCYWTACLMTMVTHAVNGLLTSLSHKCQHVGLYTHVHMCLYVWMKTLEERIRGDCISMFLLEW